MRLVKLVLFKMDILLNYIWPLIVFIFTLLTLVVIHEFGHFIFCKIFNIKVLEFGFGIPPRAWGKKFGETLVSINWLPFGGFVRPLGEDDEADLKKMSDKQRKEWNERSFQTQNVWKRIIVVVAGVVMNLLLAWVLFYSVIIAQGWKVVYPAQEPSISISYIEKNFPAATSNLQIGDKILEVNGRKPSDIEQTIQSIRNSGEEGINLTVSDLEDKNIRQLHLVGRETGGIRRIGVTFSPVPIRVYNTFQERLFSGITYSYDVTRSTFASLGRMGQQLGKQNFQKAGEGVAGPVGLAVITKNIVAQGWEAFLFYLWFMGLLSLTLFIFNILPIPALDGGRLFFLLVEAITKKKVSQEVEKKVHAVGMAVLLTLIFIITFKDITQFILPKIFR